MSDHDTVDIIGRQQLVDSLGDFQHNVERYILRSDVCDLLPFEVRKVLDPGYGIHHRVNRDGATGVSGLRARGCGTCNRASSWDNHYVRVITIRISKRLMRSE